MSGDRECKNLWWWLFTFWPNYAGKGRRWRGRDVFTRRWWRSEYIFHDSIGKFWNRAIGCWLKGHELNNIAMANEPGDFYCFKCNRHLKDM